MKKDSRKVAHRATRRVPEWLFFAIMTIGLSVGGASLFFATQSQINASHQSHD
jgi:hypothetical protein